MESPTSGINWHYCRGKQLQELNTQKVLLSLNSYKSHNLSFRWTSAFWTPPCFIPCHYCFHKGYSRVLTGQTRHDNGTHQHSGLLELRTGWASPGCNTHRLTQELGVGWAGLQYPPTSAKAKKPLSALEQTSRYRSTTAVSPQIQQIFNHYTASPIYYLIKISSFTAKNRFCGNWIFLCWLQNFNFLLETDG